MSRRDHYRATVASIEALLAEATDELDVRFTTAVLLGMIDKAKTLAVARIAADTAKDAPIHENAG